MHIAFVYLHWTALSSINAMSSCQYIFLVYQWSSAHIKYFISINIRWIIAKKCHPWVFPNFGLTSTNNIWECISISTFPKIGIRLPKARIFTCKKSIWNTKKQKCQDYRSLSVERPILEWTAGSGSLNWKKYDASHFIRKIL